MRRSTLIFLLLLLTACSPRAAVKEELAPLSTGISRLENRVAVLEGKIAALPDPAARQATPPPAQEEKPQKKPGGLQRLFQDLFGGVD
ncbi:MAG TPA: hypothetical protein VNX25_01055 [Verrucomicrobiae bacterium]|nr:hypothetical protein [Verrucomicrobiae bacterium]